MQVRKLGTSLERACGPGWWSARARGRGGSAIKGVLAATAVRAPYVPQPP
jgi:hypothetical protein